MIASTLSQMDDKYYQEKIKRLEHKVDLAIECIEGMQDFEIESCGDNMVSAGYLAQLKAPILIHD